jgi:hypothetical protein
MAEVMPEEKNLENMELFEAEIVRYRSTRESSSRGNVAILNLELKWMKRASLFAKSRFHTRRNRMTFDRQHVSNVNEENLYEDSRMLWVRVNEFTKNGLQYSHIGMN